MARVIDYTCINKYKAMNIHSGPGHQFPQVGILPQNTTIHCTEEENMWYHHNKGGWSTNEGWKWLSIIADNTKAVTTNTTEMNLNAQEDYVDFDVSDIDFIDYNNKIGEAAFTRLRGIHGMPYQFMNSVDRRTVYKNKEVTYGRTFTDRIITKFPVLVLSPGKPGFMKGFSDDKKKGIVNAISQLASGNLTKESSILEEILGGQDGRYYTFEFDYKSYYQYVNGMCRQSALMLGIGGKDFMGTKLQHFDWSQYVESGLKGFFSGNEYVCFYIEADSQISDSFSNSTGESMLAGLGDKASEVGKEVQFLLGAGAGIDWDALDPSTYESNINKGAIDNLVNKYAGSGGLLKKLQNGINTISVGGNLIFPEIWKESSFSRSYDITVKLASPDGDDLSIFLNCFVPLYHLLALVMPRAISVNSYYSPFLVRGFYKGYFNCDLGIITDMTVTRGSEGGWNINGLPTEIEVRFTLKDLYDSLAMSNPQELNGVKKFIQNTPYLDFLANMVGVNLNTPELGRTLTYYVVQQGNRVVDLKQNFLLGVSNSASNMLKSILK